MDGTDDRGLTLTASVEDLNLALHALAQLPYHQVAPLIERWTAQGREQVEKINGVREAPRQ